MDGAGFVSGNSKSGFADHGAEKLLTDMDGVLVLHFRQFGVVVGGHGDDIIVGIPAGQVDV